MIQILEGTWEEVSAHASELRGRRVQLTVLDAPSNGAANGTNGTIPAVAPQELQMSEGALKDLLAIAYQFPINPDAPRDGAAQLDHYLYGMPKNPENNVE